MYISRSVDGIGSHAMNYRWTRTFSSAAAFSSELGSIGVWVGPRTGKSRRNHGQKEDYALRRLLVAWRQQGQLRYPLTVCATATEPVHPDFLLAGEHNPELGIEVTEAGTPEWQAKLSQMERDESCGKDIAEEVLPYGTQQDAIGAIRTAIEEKSKKASKGWYRNCECDLLVYDNTSRFERITKTELPDFRSSGLRTPFRQIHLISGNFVYTDVLGVKPQGIDVSQDYDIDFTEWIAEQVEFLRKGQLNRLDVESIMEELTALAISDRRALRSHLRVLLLHLLKSRYQPNPQNRSWKASINNARAEIEDLLTSSPSLGRELKNSNTDGGDSLSWAYRKARKSAADETGLEIETFPASCPFELDEIFDEEFFG